MAAPIVDRAQLRASLLAALAYFDLFDHPLTLAELRRWRWGGPPQEPDLAAVADALVATPTGETDGFFYLKGREAIVAVRQRRYRLAEKKFRRARRLAWLARLLPSVRLIAVCNSLALSNADTGSDIDLFIVCRPGTLWITRLLLAGALHVLGLRPRPGDSADKFCLSFFLAENNLDISGLALPEGDVYLRYWIAALTPVYDAGGVLAEFLSANGWVSRDLPGLFAAETGERRAVAPARSGSGGLVAAWLRRWDAPARRFQEKRFPPEIAALANRDSRVVVADNILKFHVTDRRCRFEREFRARLRALGL